MVNDLLDSATRRQLTQIVGFDSCTDVGIFDPIKSADRDKISSFDQTIRSRLGYFQGDKCLLSDAFKYLINRNISIIDIF